MEGDALNQSANAMNRPRLLLTQAAFAALCLVSGSAQALGLGRLQVQSALGETLRAEIEVSSLTAEEAATLRVRVAPPDIYRTQGLDYNAVLAGTRVELVRRGDRAILRVTSDRAVQEPFVDLLLDVRWSTGRLNREFTLLFDPPSAMTAPAPSTAPVVSAPAPAVSALPPAAAPAPMAAPAPRAPRPQVAAESDGSVVVRGGDTLSRIGQRHRPEGVSLDQMLAALYRENPNAFLGSNINLLKAGARLRLPSRETATAISSSEARSLVRAHSSNFDAVRQGLASAAPQLPAQSERSARGSVQPQVTETRPATPGGDRLTLSKPSAVTSAASEAALNQNVQDLKKLADAARQEAAPAASAVASDAAVVGAAAAASVAASVALPASVPAVKPAPAPAPAAASGSLLDWLLSPLGAALGVGVLAIGAALALRLTRRKQGGTPQETLFGESRLQPDSFFGVTGGQRVDTRDGASGVSSMSYSLSQLDAHGDVDPVAEADVYLAYGRDLQAEEILKEALRAQPERLAIRLKLLEVYAKRRDVHGFEQLAVQLYGETKGTGEDWEKAQALGQSIDPDNALYQPGGAPRNRLADDKSRAVPVDPLNATTLAQTMPMAEAPPAAAAPEPDAGPPSLIDLDLDLPTPAPAPAPAERTQSIKAAPELVAPDLSMDLDLSDAGPSTVANKQDDDNGLAFDLSDLGGLSPAPAPTTPGALEGGRVGGDSLIDAMQDLAGDDADPMQRQLELAEEFRQIGDVEGARDVLQELINQVGSGPLVERAKAMLDKLR